MSSKILFGDCRETLKGLEAESCQCCVTSPPYWGLRKYGDSSLEMGQEDTPELWVAELLKVFSEVWRVLKPDGTLWVNVGDSYMSTAPDSMGAPLSQQGIMALVKDKTATARVRRRPELSGALKSRDLVGAPWMLAFALRAAGWYLRSDIIWHKPNCMPESVTDRPTRSHEYIFLFSKNQKYFYDAEAIREPCAESTVQRLSQNIEAQAGSIRANGGAKTNGSMKAVVGKQSGHSRRHDGFNDRWDKMEKAEQCSGMRNKRDVWTVSPAAYAEAHFATFPPDLIRPCILAGSRSGDTVLDPFSGSGTTGQVALEYGRSFIGCELYEKFAGMIKTRTAQPGLKL